MFSFAAAVCSVGVILFLLLASDTERCFLSLNKQTQKKISSSAAARSSAFHKFLQAFIWILMWCFCDDVTSVPEVLTRHCDAHESWQFTWLTFGPRLCKYFAKNNITRSLKKRNQANAGYIYSFTGGYLYISMAGCSFQCGRRSGQCGPQCCTAPPGAVYLLASGLLPSPAREALLLISIHVTPLNFCLYPRTSAQRKTVNDFTSRTVVSFSFIFPALFFTCVFLVSTHTTLSFTSDLGAQHRNTW